MKKSQSLLKRGLVTTRALSPDTPAATQTTPTLPPNNPSAAIYTTCPECNAELQASVKLYLYGISVDSKGQVMSYEGGPQPESEEDILEIVDSQNTNIYCANDHPFIIPTTQPENQTE